MTHYEVLNIKHNATDKDIKNAYRALAKKYHPDTYKGNKNVAEEKMKQINEAYDVLSNKDLKSKYDEQFNVDRTSPIQENPYSKSYYNYETYEYKSPDPREADYRTYYNYEPDCEYEPEYDFSKLKELFMGSIAKVVFIVIGIISILVFLFYLINQLRLQAIAILDSAHEAVEPPRQLEVLPQNQYENNNYLDMPDINTQDINVPQITEEEIEKKLTELEEELNIWYETEGKQYEQEIKEGLDSFYKELINQVNINN